MCHITIVKQTKDQAIPSVEATIKDIIVDKMTDNKDGFFVANKATSQEIRTLNMKLAEDFMATQPLDSLIVHSRIATTGSISQDNVHGWQIGQFQFAHNGQVLDYASFGTYDHVSKTYVKDLNDGMDVDSLMLFRKIVAGLTNPTIKQVCKAIRREVFDVGFWGRACLYDKQADRLFLFGDWQIYLVADHYLVLSSSALDFNDTSAVKSHGFKFETITGFAQELVFDGLGVINNFSTSEFHFQQLGELKTERATTVQTYGYGYQSADDRPYHEPRSNKIYGKTTLQDIILAQDEEVASPTFNMFDRHNQIIECFIDPDDGLIHDLNRMCCEIDTCDQFYDYDAKSTEAIMQARQEDRPASGWTA